MTTNKKKKHANKQGPGTGTTNRKQGDSTGSSSSNRQLQPQQQQEEEEATVTQTSKPKQKHETETETTPGRSSATSVTPPPPPPAPQLDEESRLRLERATEAKVQGNAAFGQQKLDQAIDWYTRGLHELDAIAAKSQSMPVGNNGELLLVQTQLLSNRAQVHIKLQQYEHAIQDCTAAVDELDESKTSMDPVDQNHYEDSDLQLAARAKVWYRRALAREQLALQSLHPQSQSTAASPPSPSLLSKQSSLQLLELAVLDLRSCLKLGPIDQAMKETALKAALRLQKTLEQHQQQSQSQTTKQSTDLLLPRSNGTTPATSAPVPAMTADTAPPTIRSTPAVALLEPAVHPTPSVHDQGHDIWQVLLARRQAPVLPGEAFYLMDWEWWCDWCAHVHFLEKYTSTRDNEDEDNHHLPENDNDENRKTLLLECLPPGAVLPVLDDQEDSPVAQQVDTSPGYIDNAVLLLPPPTAVPRKKGETVSTQTMYLHHWYQDYHHCTQDEGNNKNSSNTARTLSSLSSFLALQPGLVRGRHYELLHREVYQALRMWYGELTPPIVRRATVVVDASQQQQTPELKIILYPLHPRLFSPLSLSSTLSKKPSTPSLLGPCGLCAAPTGTTRCSRCQTVYYCDRECQARHWKICHKAECQRPTEDPGNENQAPNNNNTATSRRRRGLNNVGNTCFLNSALQCLAHATPLTRLFLSGQFTRDLNPQNPLGSGGKLAYAYEQVVTEMHHGRAASFSPTALKRAVAAVAPRFAGCHQHDAQEFLAYLLDGLHEDLNRVRQAPYVELPDFDGATDCHAVAGATAWEAHGRRNDSLVRDTFYGQFKSQCVCPQCDRVSVSFDAFNHVSLEIPTPPVSDSTLSVLLMGQPGCLPMRLGITVRRGNRVSDVRKALSHFTGVPEEHFFLGDVGPNHELECLHPDDRSVMQLQPDGLIAYIAEPLEENLPTEQMGIGININGEEGGSDKIPTLHLVVRHKLKSLSSEPTGERSEENYFGIPLFISLTNTRTCRDFWNGIWRAVCHNVEGGDGQGLKDANDVQARQLLQIRLVTRNGDPIPFLTDETGVGASAAASEDALVWPEEEEKKESARSSNSIIPPDSDQLLTNLIRPGLLEKIFFVHLEWTCPPSKRIPTDKPHINPERFFLFEDHPSWIEAEKKLRASIEGAKKGVALDQCFQAFTTPERLDEHNTWYCSKCKAHVRAMKTMQLWKLPNVLIVALKRFEFKHSLRREKLDTMVDFPLEGLDMGKYCASRGLSPVVDDQVPAIYDCFGVVNHYGRMGFGHYTAFARHWDETGMSDDWALFDDSSVRPVSHAQANIVTNAAYVMFYRRRTFH